MSIFSLLTNSIPPLQFPLKARRRRTLHAGRMPTHCVWLFLLAMVIPATAQVRLKEFLAVNTTGIQDEDGSYQGWIELWNSNQNSKATLTNMRLTNGTDTWIFPTAEIMPDEHLIVWASGKDRRTTTEPLHTNFTIPAGGGSLSLLSSTGTTISSLASYPAQTPNVSYGRDESDTAATPSQTGFYMVPTPGERNNYLGTGVAGKVVFSQTSKAYLGTTTLTLSLAEPAEGAEIRYTTTRLLPTATSTLYTAPITISTTQMIRARVYQPGKLPGETSTEAFLLLNPGTATQNFNSTMPVMIVSNFLTSPPPESKTDQRGFMWVWEPALPGFSTVTLTDSPTFTSSVRLRRRGSSTLGNAKYNLDLELRNAWDDDERDAPLLGLPEHSDFIMHAPFSFDRSLIHNPFIFEVSNSIGRYAPRNRMAEVFLEVNGSSLTFTGSSSGDYYGVYNILEKIRRGGNRMNLSGLDTYDNDPATISGGYVWKVDRADADESFSAGGVPGSGGIGMAYDYPNGLQMKSPQRDPQEKYLTNYLNAFYAALQANDKDPLTGWPAYLDILATIDHHLLNSYSLNVDALRLSGYWHKDRGEKMAAGPIWDFDRAFASADDRSNTWMNRLIANPANGIWRAPVSDYGTDFFNKSNDATGVQTPVWWHSLFRDPDFYQAYIDRWQELRTGAFSLASTSAVIDTLNAEIVPAAVTRDTARWPSNPKRSYNSKVTSQFYTGQAAEIQRMKDFLFYRGNFMDSQWVGPVTPSIASGKINPGTAITLTGPAGATIYYTLDGSDPRPSGGGNPDNPAVQTYNGTPIVISSTTRLRARAHLPSHTALTGLNKPSANLNNPPLLSTWGGLSDLFYSTDPPPFPGSLVITELNFHPTDPTASELAINPAWTSNDFEFIELRNLSSTPLDLSGVQITTGVTYTIAPTEGISLASGQYLLIASNPTALAARYGNAVTSLGPWSGNLSNGGELLTLTDAAGSVLLTLTYDDAWSTAADGNGSTLQVIDPAAANYGTAANWTTSTAQGGSPGAADKPGVFAGLDQGSPLSGVTLKGLLEGVPQAASFTVAWTQISGPGTTTFAPSDALTTNTSFSAPGTYVLRLAASDSAVSVSDQITIYATQSPEEWLAANPGIGGLEDDFDKDGRTNLLEYALLTDPAVPNGSEPPITGISNGFLTLTFDRIRPPAAVSYQIEVSNDLMSFRAALPGEFTETIVANQGNTQTVRYTDTAPEAPAPRFLRVKVTTIP